MDAECKLDANDLMTNRTQANTFGGGNVMLNIE